LLGAYILVNGLCLFHQVPLGTITFALSQSGVLFGLASVSAIRVDRAIGVPAETNVAPPIYVSPGWRLHRLAAWWFSPKTFRLVFEPTLSDMQVEYIEALKVAALHKARWIRLRGYLTFWTHVFAQIPVSLIRMLMLLWKAV
jgi:hypothetical protein